MGSYLFLVNLGEIWKRRILLKFNYYYYFEGVEIIAFPASENLKTGFCYC